MKADKRRRLPKASKYFSTSEVAQMLGWRPQRAKRWLIRQGAGVKRGRYWYTTDALLRAHFPEAFHEALLNDEQ